MNELLSHLLDCSLIKFNIFPQFFETPNSAQSHSNALQLDSGFKPLLQNMAFMFSEDVGPHTNHYRLTTIDNIYIPIVTILDITEYSASEGGAKNLVEVEG